jgi:hypothetical protein
MAAAEMREMEARFGNKRRPSPADSVRSANRIAKEEDNDSRSLSVFKQGGKVRKYAEGGPVRKSMPPSTPMPDLNETMSNLRNQFGVMGSSGQYDMKGLQDLVNSVNTAYSQRGAPADQVKDAYMRGFTNLQKTPQGVGSAPGVGVTPELIAPMYGGNGSLRPTQEQIKEYYASGKGGAWDPDKGAFLTTKERDSMIPPPKVYDTFRPRVMPQPTPLPPPPPTPEPMMRTSQPEPYYPGNDVFQPTPPTVYDNFPPGIIDKPRDPMQPQNPPGISGISSAIRDLLTKQPPTKGPMSPRGMGLLEQRQPRMPEKNVTMMKHGGRAAMPKGKR